MSVLLQIKNVTKKFGDHVALKGVSFDLYKAEIVSLLGINGAGKTTLSSIIATLHPATSGDVLLDNTSIYNDVISYRKLVGYCPQKPNLNNLMSAHENLVWAGRYFGMTEKQITSRIEELGNNFGLEPHFHKKPDELSGGCRQRFSIARSLIHSPKLLILDEPTVALDPHVRRKLWDYIKEIRTAGTSILLTTHYLDEAEILSDRVCVLDKGTIKLIDTPANLMADFKQKNLEDVFINLMEHPDIE